MGEVPAVLLYQLIGFRWLQFVIQQAQKLKMLCSANQQENNTQKDTVKKIGSYLFRYGDVLGRGNFSTVYSGVDENSGRQVAVKVVKISSLKSKTSMKLLQNEISILKDLDHPNVIKCYDELTSINNCYIITQLCSGDLDNILKKRGHFQEKQIFKWVWEVLKGLQYLQKNSIIHRDLKVNNIFISSNGVAKIADFGFAMKCKQKIKDISIGSPIYMSPQGLIYNQYSPKTDVWSFGILIYQLLHGYTPLDCCKTQLELKQKVIEPPVIKSKISIELLNFLSFCLKVNDAERFSVSQLMETPYARRIKAESEGSKIYKTYSSGFNSTLNSTAQTASGSQSFNKLVLNNQISYDCAVSILHYCRLIHKTYQKAKSQILSQWLLNVSLQLLKSKISRNHTDKEQYEKLKQVIIQYHNKYQKQHEDFKGEVLISDVLKECELMVKFSEARIFVNLLIKQTRLIRQCMQLRNWEHFCKNSESKSFLLSPNNKCGKGK